MADDNTALLLQISYDLNTLKKQGDKAAGQVDASLSAIEKRAKKTALELEESLSFKNVNAGAALTNVLSGLKEGTVEEASAHLGVFGSALGALGPLGLIAAGGVTAAGFAIERGMKTAEWAEDLEHASRTLGLTTTQLQQFDFIATSAGIPVDKMRESMAGLAATIGNVKDGLAKAQVVKAFTDGLKITPEDLRGWGDLNTQLPHILDAASKLDAEARDGLAKKLKVDPDVLASMIEAREDFDSLIAKAREYGIVMDEAGVKKSAEAAKEMKVASAIIKGELNVAFADLAPLAVAGANALVSITTSTIDLVNGINQALGPLGDFIAGLKQIPGLKAAADVATRAASDTLFPGSGMIGDAMNSARLKGYYARQNAAQDSALGDMVGLKAQNDGPKTGLLSPPKAKKAKGGGGDQTDQLTATAQADLDSADKALAEAQKALTTNIQARSDLEAKAIADESDKQQAKLQKDLAGLLKNDKIDGALSDQLQAKIEQAQTDTELAKQAKLQLLSNKTQQELADQANAMSRIGIEGQEAMLRAQDALGPNATRRAQIAQQLFALDEQLAESKLQEVIASKTATEAQIAQAKAELANLQATLPLRQQASDNSAAQQITDQKNALAELGLQGQVELLDAERGVITTTAKRRDIALKLFALDEQIQEMKLQEVIDSKTSSDAEKQRAKAELANLQATLNLRQQAANQANPTNSWAGWLQDANASVKDVGEALAKARVDGVEAFNAKLFDGEGRFQGLGQAARAFGTTAIVALEQWGVKAAEVGLFGNGQSGGLLGGLMGGQSGASGGGLLGGLFGGKGGSGNKPDGTSNNPLFVSIAASTPAGGLSIGGLLGGGGAAATGAGGQAAAAAGGGGGVLSSIIGGIGHIFGFANGGQFTVGGPAGIDRNLAVMKLSRNEKVTVETEAQQRAGGGRRVGGTNIFNFPNSSVDGFRKSQRQVARTARQSIEGR
jgi:hypothetical protein